MSAYTIGHDDTTNGRRVVMLSNATTGKHYLVRVNVSGIASVRDISYSAKGLPVRGAEAREVVSVATCLRTQ